MHLGRTLPCSSNGLPAGRLARTAPPPLLAGIPAYLAFLQVGFAVPASSPERRWALTPPFHPCLSRANAAIGGLFSVALSRALRPVGVTHHLVLWSPDFPRRIAPTRSPGHPGTPMLAARLTAAGDQRTRRHLSWSGIEKPATLKGPLAEVGLVTARCCPSAGSADLARFLHWFPAL